MDLLSMAGRRRVNLNLLRKMCSCSESVKLELGGSRISCIEATQESEISRPKKFQNSALGNKLRSRFKSIFKIWIILILRNIWNKTLPCGVYKK